MTTDNGNWLSAEQAVLPDGTERAHLPLIHRKLPTLAPPAAGNTVDSGEQAVGAVIGITEMKG